LDLPRLESVLRVALGCGLAFGLSVISAPNTVPSSLSFMVGIMGAALTLSLPKQLFAIGAVFPFLIAMLILALLGGTALLAAATVSDGFLMLIFSLYALFFSGFYFGSHFDKTAGAVNIVIAMGALIALSNRELVQNGFAIPLTEEYNILQVVCAIQGVPQSLCTVENLPEDVTEFIFQIPDSVQNFGGQMATVNLTTNMVFIDGGLWIVKGFWTWSGTTNGLALFRNLLICACWACLCAIAAILLPPVRFMRDQMSKALVPGSLMQASSLIEKFPKQSITVDENDVPEPAAMSTMETTEVMRLEYGALVHLLASMNGGKAAGVILFEPRFLRAPTENLTPKLADLMFFASRALLGCLITATHTTLNLHSAHEASAQNVSKMIVALQKCAAALSKNDATLLSEDESVEQSREEAPIEDPDADPEPAEEKIDSTGDGAKELCTDQKDEPQSWIASILGFGGAGEPTPQQKGEEAPPEQAPPIEDPDIDSDDSKSIEDEKDDFLGKRADDLVLASKNWIDAINNPERVDCGAKGWKNVASIYIPWILLPFLLLIRQAQILIHLPFRKRYGSLMSQFRSILWVLKLVAGYVFLFAMTVFWDEYSDFKISLPNGNVGSVFHGWQLSAYAFVWLPTVEGTLSKASSRIFGTACGGFSAWLGAIVCSWSYDENAQQDPYAVAAWLTTTTAATAWFFNSHGQASYAGLNNDTKAFATYFAVTQALILLEIYENIATRDDLVVNRTVATLAGSVMAVILAMIPPYARGNDPQWLRNATRSCQQALAKVLKDSLDDSRQELILEDKLKYRERILGPPVDALRLALFLLKDSQTNVKFLPFLKAEPSLHQISDDLTVAISLLGYVMDLLFEALEEGFDLTMQSTSSDRLRKEVPVMCQTSIDMLEGDDHLSEDEVLERRQKQQQRFHDLMDEMDGVLSEKGTVRIGLVISAAHTLGVHLRSCLLRLDALSPESVDRQR